MNISVSLDYDEITFNHSVLNTATISGLRLEYKLNCGTISSSIDLNAKIATINNTDKILTLNVSDIDASKTVFTDGVYYFKLTVLGPVVEGKPGTYVLTGCIYICTTSRCKAVVAYEASNN